MEHAAGRRVLQLMTCLAAYGVSYSIQHVLQLTTCLAAYGVLTA
jgi:hypothetical protein